MAPELATREGAALPVAGHHVALRLATILWFTGAVGFLLSLPIVLSWPAAVPVGIVAFALLVGLPFGWLLRRISLGERGRPFARSWAKATIAAVFLLSMAVAFPVYWLAWTTAAKPMAMPTAVLTNGQKKIIFQGMAHIGSEAFYKAVVYDLEDALESGAAFYYEGIKPSTPVDDRWFSQVMSGGAQLGDRYKDLAKACGLRFQLDYFNLVEKQKLRDPSRFVVADIDTGEMHRAAQAIAARSPRFAATLRERETQKPEKMDSGFDPFATAVAWQDSGNKSRATLAGILCRGFFTIELRDQQAGEMDPLILDYRNKVLARFLTRAPQKTIYVTYGAAHLPGTLAALRTIDPKWRVASLKWSRTVAPPDEVQGNVPGL